jgi:hypothetical protein
MGVWAYGRVGGRASLRMDERDRSIPIEARSKSKVTSLPLRPADPPIRRPPTRRYADTPIRRYAPLMDLRAGDTALNICGALRQGNQVAFEV